MATRTEIAAALDELIEAAVAWEAGDPDDGTEDRLADAVFRFRSARGDFAESVRPASNLELFAQLVAKGMAPEAAGAAVRESA